jgi:hypothetical protein
MVRIPLNAMEVKRLRNPAMSSSRKWLFRMDRHNRLILGHIWGIINTLYIILIKLELGLLSK